MRHASICTCIVQICASASEWLPSRDSALRMRAPCASQPVIPGCALDRRTCKTAVTNAAGRLQPARSITRGKELPAHWEIVCTWFRRALSQSLSVTAELQPRLVQSSGTYEPRHSHQQVHTARFAPGECMTSLSLCCSLPHTASHSWSWPLISCPENSLLCTSMHAIKSKADPVLKS